MGRWKSQVTAKDVAVHFENTSLSTLTDNANVRGNYSSVIKDVILDPNNPQRNSRWLLLVKT